MSSVARTRLVGAAGLLLGAAILAVSAVLFARGHRGPRELSVAVSSDARWTDARVTAGVSGWARQASARAERLEAGWIRVELVEQGLRQTTAVLWQTDALSLSLRDAANMRGAPSDARRAREAALVTALVHECGGRAWTASCRWASGEISRECVSP